MRILLITHNVILGDGQGRVNYEIARYCLAQGHEVTILATRVDPDLIATGARWVSIPSTLRRAGVFHHWQFARMADRHVAQLRTWADIVVGNGYTVTAPHEVNLSHFVHHAWRRHRIGPRERGPRAWYQSFYSRCNERLERTSYDAAGVVVAVSHRVRGELLSAGLPERKVRVIHSGVDLDDFHPGIEDRPALGLPADVPLGLFVGDVRTYRKNLDTVLRALVNTPSIHLAVVGAFDRSPFPAMASALGIADRVHFLGFRRDVARIMRGCTFLAFPTRYEPFGLVILEAMSSGLPVVTTRIAGAAELLNEDGGVLLDDPESVKSLAEAMEKMSNAAIRIKAGDAARNLAESHSWTHMARRYLELFEEIHHSRSAGLKGSR
jgi:glycosyltransferase involved in cell wall biosynthesis